MINKIISKQNDKTNCIEYLTIENINYYESKAIAKEFGKHFSQVGRKYAQGIKDPRTNIKEYVKKIPTNSKSMFTTPTTSEEILGIISKLPNKTSKGHDDISNMLLKKLKDSISMHYK